MLYFAVSIFSIAIIALLFWYFKSPKKLFVKDIYKTMPLTKIAIKHSPLGLFVSLVAKLLHEGTRTDTLTSNIIDIMLSDIASLFSNAQEAKNVLLEIVEEQQSNLKNTKSIAHALYELIEDDKQKQQQFIEYIAYIIFLNKETVTNYETLVTVAETFQIPQKVYNEVFNQLKNSASHIQQQTVENAYNILHTNPNNNFANIAREYQIALRKNYLNILDKKEKSYDEAYGEYYVIESFLKIQEIHHAYEAIKRQVNSIKKEQTESPRK